MMELVWKAIVLGIVQGLTEFLPISSTGHMIIVDEFLQLPPEFAKTFLVVVQLGSMQKTRGLVRNAVTLTWGMPQTGQGSCWDSILPLGSG